MSTVLVNCFHVVITALGMLIDQKYFLMISVNFRTLGQVKSVMLCVLIPAERKKPLL